MYQKEIIYIGLYKDGSRMGSAGFLKVESKERESRLYLKVQNIPLGISGKFPVRIYNGTDWKELNSITIHDGCGNWEDNPAENVDKAMVQVMLSGGYMLEGKSKSAPKRSDMSQDATSQDTTYYSQQESEAGETEKQDEKADKKQPDRQPVERPEEQSEKQPEALIVTEELPHLSSGNMDVMPRSVRDHNIDVMPQSVPDHNLKEDKWEQILDTYEKIHPYGDERVYVKLEPKDFVILQSKYQHLVNNSFLLHGFYNYRYVILGKEQDYYLGVPGVFYEREKMVALMFGFEAFECPGGNVRAGEFGYYLRKVEL